MILKDCFLTFHNKDKQSDVSLKNKDSHSKTGQQQKCIATHLLSENGVIYSHIFITLQASILPAKNFNELKLFVDKWVPVLGPLHCFFSRISRLLSVSRLCCGSHHFVTAGCCGSSALSGSGRTWEEERKKLTKAALPASVADPQRKALKLGFKPPKRKDGDCGWRWGGAPSLLLWSSLKYYYVTVFTALIYSSRCMKVFKKRMRSPLMCQHKYKRTRILMNIKMSLHTAAAEDESVRYEQRDQEREWELALE